MKKCFFAVALLLPLLAAAQAEPGTYILVDNRQVKYQGQLKIVDGELRARDNTGKKQVWKASEVYWAGIGPHHYLPVREFQVPTGLNFRTVAYGLAEVLDSGRVTLLRYDYQFGNAATGYGGMSEMSAYLLQLPDEENARLVPMNYYSGKGAAFREMLAPYFASRPDLLALLEKRVIKRRNLAAFIHAFNTRQPFVDQPNAGPPDDISQD